MIKVYAQEKPTIELEGTNISAMVSGDLEAFESNGNISIRRTLHNNKSVVEEIEYTQFQDKSGAALGTDNATTITALNEIFSKDATPALTTAGVDAAVAAYLLTNPPSVASKDYASFYLSTGGLTNLAATASTVVINETNINTNPLKFVLLLNQVTITTAGNYRVDFGCYLNNASTSRTEYTFWLELNGTEILGSRSGNYQRGYDSGQSSDISMIISVNANDVLRARVQRTDGSSISGYQDNNGTRLVIEEV